MLAVGAVLALPGIASAALTVNAQSISVGAVPTVNYSPSPSDLYDLDGHYVYTWALSNLATTGTLTGASITFKQMYNWDANPNDLFIHLLDTAKTLTTAPFTGDYNSTSGSNLGDKYGTATATTTNGATSKVSWFVDETAATVSTLRDDFSSTLYHSDPNWLVAVDGSKNDIGDTYLDQQSFPTAGVSPTANGGAFPGPDKGFTALPGSGPLTAGNWYYTTDGTVTYNGVTSTAYDYTYVFTAAQLATLGAYISNGGDVALGLDPDCHYYNSGVAFNLYESVGGQATGAVPEPASIFLLGTGLAFAATRYRRKVAKK